MMTNKKIKKTIFLLWTAMAFFSSQAVICRAQQDEQEKSIQSEEFLKKRPSSKKALTGQTADKIKTPGKKISKNANVKTKKRLYRVIKTAPSKIKTVQPNRKTSTDNEAALLGLTVWKLQPASDADEVKELIEEANGKMPPGQYTWKRIQSDTPLQIDDRIRLSLESLSRDGYLYVVERELYSDGTYSSPQLIYPTLRTKNRDVPISAGNLVFIPESSKEKSTWFRVTAKQIEKKQVAEVLTVIISPRSIIEQAMLKTAAIDLPSPQFADWLKQWEVESTLLEQIDGAGEAITLSEQAAGESAKGLTEESGALTKDDPTPQSIYRTAIKRDSPLLVNVVLKFASN